MSHRNKNQEILAQRASKAAHTLQTTLATSGRLNLEQRRELISLVFDLTGISNIARTEIFSGRGTEITTVNFGGRAAVRDTEGVDRGIRRNVTPNTVNIDGVYIKLPLDIGFQFGEQNVAEEDGENQIKKLFADSLANDVEELVFHGDLLGPSATEDAHIGSGSTTDHVVDDYLNLQDGLISQAFAGGVVIDGADSNNLYSLVSDAYKGLPEKYRRNRDGLRNLMSTDIGQNYRYNLQFRDTDLGDHTLSSGAPALNPFGLQFSELHNWRNTPTQVEHFTLTETGTFTLRNQNITELVITRQELANSAETPFVLTTDYTINNTTGVITHVGGGGITAPDNLKATYKASPMMLMTPKDNIIIGMSSDIRFDEWFNPHTGLLEVVMRVRVASRFQDPAGVILVKNIQDAYQTS